MTTPERLRRRQLRNDWFVAILCVALAASVIFFNWRDGNQSDCLARAFASSSETSQVRAKLVRQESRSFRRVIKDAGKARTREDFDDAIDAAKAKWGEIDAARDRNPVEPFDPETDC